MTKTVKQLLDDIETFCERQFKIMDPKDGETNHYRINSDFPKTVYKECGREDCLNKLKEAKRAKTKRIPAKQRIAEQKDLCADWPHPIGTRCAVRRDDGSVKHTMTRSMPWMLCNHAVILVQGISGCYRLDRLTMFPAPEPIIPKHDCRYCAW